MASGHESDGKRIARKVAIAARFSIGRRFLSGLVAGTVLLALCLPSPCAAREAAGQPASAALPADAAADSRVSCFELRKYANLPELVIAVSREAGRFFSDFYGPTMVSVQPFVFLTESGEKRFSPMGATLADQMIAVIHNQPGFAAGSGSGDQELQGVLLEMDGYLRIHISGVNSFNLHRSYTAQVEMSEALYRALYADTF